MNVSDGVKRLIEKDTFFYGILIVLVAVCAFGLGRWSGLEAGNLKVVNPQKSIEVVQKASVSDAISQKSTSTEAVQGEAVTEAQPPATAENALYVGSRNGTKYHLLTCPGAKQIKDENKVFFATKLDAQKAGYSPASNCKGI